MRIAFVATAALAAAVCLSACHKKTDAAAGNAAAGGDASAASASSSSGPAGDLTAANMPHRKLGLWKIHMSGTGFPTMDTSQCVGPNTDKDMSAFAAKGAANRDCTSHYSRGLDGTISGETTCATHGISTTMKTTITGDFGSHYHMHMESTTTGGPATGPMSGTRVMDGDVTWSGPCTPGPND